MTAKDIEIKLAKYFDTRSHLIIPNLSYGLLDYEADMFIVRESGYCLEVEIKVSKSDIKADTKKSKWKNNNAMFGRVSRKDYIIREFYMAVPWELRDDVNIPKFAGIFAIDQQGYVELIRKPKIWKIARKITVTERAKLGRLLGLSFWNLNRELYERKNNGR